MAENSSQSGAPPSAFPAGYTIRAGLPAPAVYQHIRSAAGLIAVTAAQAAAAVQGSWYGCQVVHRSAKSSSEDEGEGQGETVVGMGAVIANGSWYFHIVDIAILPEHQRKGLGKAVINSLMAYIMAHKAEGMPFISLSAVKDGVGLYKKCEFVEGEKVGEYGMVWAGTYLDKLKKLEEDEKAQSG